MFDSLTFERVVTCNPTILDDIAFYVAVDPFLGPPVNLLSLFLTCRTIYNHLSMANNSRLYANIFLHKFDSAAIERRLSERWTSPPCLAQELRNRCISLRHIRRGSPSVHLDREALWEAYLMMLENDGRNERHLLWANLPDWIIGVVVLRSAPSSTTAAHSAPHLSDPEGISLAMWLLWMTSSKDRVTAEHVAIPTTLTNAVLPFLVRGYKYPSLFAPDTYFYLPLCEDHDEFSPGFSGPPPLVTQIRYLGQRLNLAVPPLTTAALLNFVVRQEAWQDTLPLPSRISLFPATREEAITRGLETPAITQEDIREFHYHTRTSFFQKHGASSERHDRDWYRLVSCHSPYAIERPLKGIVYPLGTLVGNWNGRILVPDVFAHLSAIRDQRLPPSSVPLIQERIACRFEEHHCLSFSEPLLAPPCPDGLGEDIFNAWLPRGLQFTRRADGLEIFDPSTGKNTWYETYYPAGVSHYSTRASERLANGSELEWCGQEDPPAMQEDTEEVDEYEDFVEELSSGVQDIIITGETCVRQGEAWGYYSYIGRIRPWDGLVAFLRIPMNNQSHDRGRWLFKGYVHERSLVGRWRDTATNVHAVGVEGGFVLCQEDEVNRASVDL